MKKQYIQNGNICYINLTYLFETKKLKISVSRNENKVLCVKEGLQNCLFN